MSGKSHSPFGAAWDFAQLGFESWTVIGLRMSKLAAGGPLAMAEAQRMVTEKAVAAVEAQFNAGMALAAGATHQAVGRKAISGYRRRVRANRRRLAKP